ncbi:hypothetical protein GDO78_022999 [Eleutherodactylus coqui]|uniref:Uncharacterized protein n=1 Tax=Eleutherodactylus coqui TaxID=57060 RepID=A0A8J6BDC8_ELECQ|nr:hypothetical protein GDO78_022999 [Eleutherodactylus coqui]
MYRCYQRTPHKQLHRRGRQADKVVCTFCAAPPLPSELPSFLDRAERKLSARKSPDLVEPFNHRKSIQIFCTTVGPEVKHYSRGRRVA